MLWAAMVIFSLMGVGQGQAGVVGEVLTYQQADTTLKGYLAYDEARPDRRPGVLVVHEYWGLNDFARERAHKLAEMGYLALAADMYGEGKVTRDPEEARKLAGHVRSTPLLRERAQAGLMALARHRLADPHRLAAIGFCFGGTTVLELAYSGAPVLGVASFHGALSVPKPQDPKTWQTKFLILHGADDSFIKPEEISAFQEALRQAKADWQMVYFGGAVHSFANPAAGQDKAKGVAYDPKAAARSWDYLLAFLKEIFAQGRPGPAGS